MDMIRNIFPLSFDIKEVKELIIKIAIYLVAGIIAGIVMGALGKIFILGLIFKLIGAVVELYCFVGIILAVLEAFGAFR